jgi:hypothetical protein
MFRSLLVLLLAVPCWVQAEALRLEQALQSPTAIPPLTQEVLFLRCHQLAFADERADTSFNRPRFTLLSQTNAKQLSIIRRFFDVLLADIHYAARNEQLAVDFIKLDRARERHQLGETSPIDIAELEASYQQTRLIRTAALKAQQLTRQALAIVLGTPDSPPVELRSPALSETFQPIIAPTKNLASPDARYQHQLLHTRMELLQTTLEVNQAEANYRELYLDRSRALYEMEVRADLGDSMVWQSLTMFRTLQTKLCLAITQAELRALNHQPLWPLP